MEELISAIKILMGEYGADLTMFAILGIVILGVLKYAGVFKKFEESVRHFLYVLISVVFSGGTSAIYLIVMQAFDFQTFVLFLVAVFGLSQGAYALYANFGPKELLTMICKKVIEYLENNKKSKDNNSNNV